MKKIYVLAGVALMMTACGNNEKDYDATGTFEATETTVFAEQSALPKRCIRVRNPIWNAR